MIYFLRPIGSEGPVKIGSSIYPEARLRSYCGWSPIPLEIAAAAPGNADLERRFHSYFFAQHSHHEWFHASPELSAAILAIREERFDFSALPAPKDLRIRPPVTPESISSGQYVRRADKLRRLGVTIPDDVETALRTHGIPAAEVVRRRAVVKAFVDAAEAGRAQ